MTTSLLTRNYELWIQRDVAQFHDVFGHPNLFGTPQDLPRDRIELRVSLINEEGVIELSDALRKKNAVTVIDALIDTVYVSLGTLVEMGREANIELFSRDIAPAKNTDLFLHASRYLELNKRRVADLNAALKKGDTGVAVHLLNVIASKAWDVLRLSNIDPEPFFVEVQRSNMSKLGANGKPVYSRGMRLDGRPLGKIIPGPNYFKPDLKRIYRELESARS